MGVRRGVVPAIAVVTFVVCGALVVVAGCVDPGGVREEGAASSATLASATVTGRSGQAAGASGVRQAVRLVRNDPKVAKDIRDSLQSCDGASASAYPVGDRRADLTGQGRTDLVVNVSTCADGVGVGAYVYRLEHGRYVNVFADERPPVVAGAAGGRLKVTHQVYEPQDAVSNPSGEDVTTYRWTGGGFTKVSSTHRTYGAGKDSHG